MNNDELLVAIKDMFEQKVEEIKQHTGVLYEKLQSDIKAVAEGYDTLNRKIDEKATELKKEMKAVKSGIAVVKEYVIAVDEKFNEHEVILKRAK